MAVFTAITDVEEKRIVALDRCGKVNSHPHPGIAGYGELICGQKLYVFSPQSMKTVQEEYCVRGRDGMGWD